MTTIIIIFAGVVVVAIGVWFIRLLMDKRRLESAAHWQRVEDEERRARMAEPWPPKDEADETKTWPTIPPGAAA